jgi:endonuclease/exonuclease/phosphatase family metal-dependent hydrolase
LCINNSKFLYPKKVSILFVFLLTFISYAQETVRIMAYNICEYPNVQTYGDTAYRNPYFRIVLGESDPDILSVEEMTSQTNALGFLTNVLNHNGNNYAMAEFISNANDNNVLYYKTSKFSMISTPYIVDNSGHITILFKLYNINTRDTLVIYSIHLDSGEQNGDRLTQVQTIRESADSLSEKEYYMGIGDFNMYGGDEEEEPAGYIFNTASGGYFIDPLGLQDEPNWSASFLTAANTFASRTTSFGGGTTTSGSGGMDERFDLILISQTVNDEGGITLNTNSYTTMGNDGNHNDKSVNQLPNTAVSSTVADALYWASDHLPVYADFNFGSPSPGGIAFTQFGSDDPDIIEFITLNDHMDLTKLKITDSEINSSGELVNGNGTYDLNNTPWKDIPGGTFVRLGSGLSNDNNPSDRILVYNGNGSGSLPILDGGPNGDQLIAYTGSSTEPYFIAGVTWGNNGWAPESGNSYSPGTISDIALGPSPNYYFSNTANGDANEVRDALTNNSNWSSYAGTFFNNLTSYIENGALPVELSFFTGKVDGSKIQLSWKTETEVNNYGFQIERLNDHSDWINIDFVKGAGNANSPKNYQYLDSDIGQSGNYYYRLKQIDNDGTYEYSKVVTVGVSPPDKCTLSQNYPNPFNPETEIDFTLPSKQMVLLRVYNTLGELVKELVNAQREAGSYSEIFNASDLPSGVYIYTLSTDAFTQTRKMIVMK